MRLFYAEVTGGAEATIWSIPLKLNTTRSVRLSPSVHPGETQEQYNERMEWWREAKFGMFIHWGLYSQAAGEWEGERPAKGRDQRG
jgi:hypothetical protein